MNQNNQEQSSKNKQELNDEGKPRFGILLLVLLAAVVFVVVLTFASEAYYS